jgi:pimeloyl-ACP methyl ester carboxylesterase
MTEVFRDYIRRWAPVLVKPNFFGENYPGWIVNLFAELGFRRCETETKKTFINVEKLLKKPHPPLLMIHGENDDYVSARHQRFLGKIARRDCAEPWIVPKAGHNQAVVLARPEYEKKIADFLRSIS